MALTRGLSHIALIGCMCVAWAQPKSDDEVGRPAGDYERILVAIRLRNRLVSEAIPAAVDGNSRLFFPIHVFCSSLGIASSELNGEFRADLPKRDRGLAYSSGTATLTIARVTQQMPAGSVLMLDGEIHLDVSIIAAWLKSDFEFSFPKLELRLNPEFELPIEEAIRANRAAPRVPAYAKPKRTPPPGLKAPIPAMFSVPTLDFSLTSTRQDGSGDISQRFNLFATADLLNMNARLSAIGDWTRPLESVRFQLSRTSEEGNLLGPFRARTFALGDVWSASISHVALPKRGRGFEVSSFPVSRSADLNETTIVGTSLPGWRTELYRDGLLIDTGTTDEFGGYKFTNVALVVGENRFKIVSIGPNGETKTDERKQFVGYGYTRTGETNYRISAMQEYLRGNSVNPDWRLLAEVEHTINSQTSISGRAVLAEPRDYYSLGVRQKIGSALGSFDVIANSDGALGTVASLQTRVGDKNVAASVGVFAGGYISETISSVSTPIRLDANLRVDTPLRLSTYIPLFGSITLRYREFTNRGPQFQLSSRIAGTFGGISVSNSLYMRSESTIDGTEWGRFAVRKKIGSQWLRGELGYALGNQFLRSASVSADFGSSKTFRLNTGIRKLFYGEDDLVAFVSLVRAFSTGNFGLDLQVNQDGRFFGSLTYSTSIGADPRSGAVRLLPEGSAASGLVSVRAFVDVNRNGRFDDGDTPIAGASFRAARRDLVGITDEDGIALLTGFAPSVPVELSINPDSLEDPELAVNLEPVWVIPVLGNPSRVEIPIRRE